jgi:NAD(P)-dependent dehydrogenase (short-subunit alcohol dehydrogenase family)
MAIDDRTVVVTEANRGIGQELVEEVVRRGAKRAHAATRQPLAHSVGRLTHLARMSGPMHTDVTRSFDIPKASPESVSRATFDEVEKGAEDIFSDRRSQSPTESWRNGAAKALEHQNRMFVQAAPVMS